MNEEFQDFFPPAPLDRYIHRMVHMNFPQPLPAEQLAPDSYIKWTLILVGEPQYIDRDGAMEWHDGFSGHIPPERGIVATSQGPVRCVLVNFYPSAFRQLLGPDVEELNGRMIQSREVIGDAIDDLRSRMRVLTDPQGMFDVLVDFLVGLHERNEPTEPSPIEELEHRIRSCKGLLSVNEMVRSMGLSERQLQRKFKASVGLSPKEFCSVVRFNQVYRHMRRTHTLDLGIALECGYFDESHMMKDLSYYLGGKAKRFASMSRPMVDRNLGH